MRADLAKIAEVMSDAIAQARHSDTQIDDLVADAIFRLEGEELEVERHFRKEAVHWLKRAASLTDDLGAHDSVPMLSAVIGVGCALLANGEDAEVFYSMMAK